MTDQTDEALRELLHDAATALQWWLAGKPVPIHPPETHWCWRQVLLELRARAGEDMR